MLTAQPEEEHVVPRWLQKTFGLWDAQYEIAASGLQGYRLDRLKIPICQPCNRRLGRALEEPMRRMVIKEPHAIDPDIIRLWLCKISLGFNLYQTQQIERRDAIGEAVTVRPERFEETFRLHRAVLRHVGDGTALGFVPPNWSTLFVYQTQISPEHPRLNYDFVEDPTSRVIALRAGTLGFIGFLFDAGVVGGGTDTHFDRAFATQPLSPFQFRELVAHAITIGEHGLREASVKMDLVENSRSTTVHVASDALSRLADPIDTNLLAERLAFNTHMNVEDWTNGDGSILTSLYDVNNEPVRLEFRQAMSIDARRFGKPVLAPARWHERTRRKQ